MIVRIKTLMILTLAILLFSQVILASPDLEERNPYKWPFSRNSIWNMPIGDEAVYVYAGITSPKCRGLTVDEDLIVMSPEVPMVDVYYNDAGWDLNKNRCEFNSDKVLFSAPIPDDFVVNENTWVGETPNSGLAVLMPDKETIIQSQPFARPEAGGPATSKFLFKKVDLYGKGISGAHGGSKLSAIGGALRLGELVPGGEIRHVLKVNLFAKKFYYYDEKTKGYRWPAVSSDGYAREVYGGTIKALRMGSLLALPDWIKIERLGLETEPAKILAKAFQDYGAYVVDDTYWDVYAIITEWSPDGRVKDEFEEKWGFSMTPSSLDTPWARDIRKIFINLYVVDNNGPESIGGGGEPCRSLAPVLSENR